MIRHIVICLLIASVFLCGCSTTPQEKTGTMQVTSSPEGAGIYVDNEYQGTTPITFYTLPSGNHTLELQKDGYIPWSAVIAVSPSWTSYISANLSPVQTPAIVTPQATATAKEKTAVPEIHIDGYWTYPSVGSRSNPVSLLIHTEGANVGTAGAREVTTSANLYYNGRQICWTRIYLGTIAAGGHVSKDTMVSCTLPTDADSTNLKIKFENSIVN